MARPSSKPGSKKTVRTLTPYMSKIAKNTESDTSINSEAAVLLCKMLENLQNRLIVKSARIARSTKSGTLTNKHVLCGARASLPMTMAGPVSEFVGSAVARFAKPVAMESA
jgi:histone H3/H4